jgi:hypothetical protein
MSFTVGVDVGQRQDHTALTAVQAAGDEYHTRHVKRFDLGTPYPKIIEAVASLMEAEPLEDATLVVDATGVGQPIVEMFSDEGLSPVPIWITGGDSVNESDGEFRVPKRDLASTVQALLQSGRLKFADKLPFREVLTDELKKFRAKINIDTGSASFEHWRERDTDDIVLALACALWHAENAHPESFVLGVGGSTSSTDSGATGLSDDLDERGDKASRWGELIEDRLNRAL